MRLATGRRDRYNRRDATSEQRTYISQRPTTSLERSATYCDCRLACPDDADGARAGCATGSQASRLRQPAPARPPRRLPARHAVPVISPIRAAAHPDQPQRDRDRSGAWGRGQRLADQRHDGRKKCNAGAGVPAAIVAHGARIQRGDDAGCGRAGGSECAGSAMTLDDRAGIANHAHAAACLVLHATASGNGVHLYRSELEASEGQPSVVPWLTAQAGVDIRRATAGEARWPPHSRVRD